MSSNASAGNCSPGGSRSSAYSEPAASFKTYAEYLATLERSPIPYEYDIKENLWLGGFTESGQWIKWYHCRPSNQGTFTMPRNLPAVDGNGFRPDISVVSASEFQTLLRTTDEDVAYRVVIVSTGPEGRSTQVEDMLGLGLDLQPEILDYTRIRIEDICSANERNLPLPWFRDCPALSIGDNVFCISEVALRRRRGTGKGEHSTLVIQLADQTHSSNIFERQIPDKSSSQSRIS